MIKLVLGLSLLLASLAPTAFAFVVPSTTTTTTSRFFVSQASPLSSSSSTARYGFLGDDLTKGLASLFNKQRDESSPPTTPIEPTYETAVMDPDFRVAALFLVLGGILNVIPYVQLTLGPLVTALGVLFLVQTFRIRFIFDGQNALELVTTTTANDDDDDGWQSSGENVIVGGANRWACDAIVNYDFFPQDWMDGGGPLRGQPILVYFKETQTPPESWNEGPGRAANDPAKIAAGQGALRACCVDNGR